MGAGTGNVKSMGKISLERRERVGRKKIWRVSWSMPFQEKVYRTRIMNGGIDGMGKKRMRELFVREWDREGISELTMNRGLNVIRKFSAWETGGVRTGPGGGLLKT